MNKLISLTFLAAALAACTQPGEASAPAATGAAAPQPEKADAPKAKAADAPAAQAKAAQAKIGQPAPDFTLPDLDGKPVKLADHKGKTVVLEWFNPGCPFVQLAHRQGGLKDVPAQQTQKGVVWLAINSGAPGKQGTAKEENVKAKGEFGMSYPVLIDEKGDVGRAYGAQRTPHMVVIDPQGTVVYAGAIDSTKGGEPEPGEQVTNYVDAALTELAAGKAISTKETEAFGCTVKY
ncbi:thioredoxin family protein [Sorangium sp. So ce327]|jgi:peroxiredoxin|uniref:thioredoxin family protein n=1 Tax=Sorangium sp. So ce327 TaxID=3133301 RepID=UPI003F63C723